MAKSPGKDSLDDGKLEALYQDLARLLPKREEFSLDDLKTRLEQARSLYIKGGIRSRLGMTMALDSAISFLDGALDVLPGHSDRLLLPLRRLADALQGLDTGSVHISLKQSPKRGGTKLMQDEAEFRLLVCLAMASEVARGTCPQNARKDIAKRLNKAGFRQQRRAASGQFVEIDEKTLTGWQQKRGRYWRLISGDGHITFADWLYSRFFIGPHLPEVLDGSSGSKPQPTPVSHIFKILQIEFGHLRTK